MKKRCLSILLTICMVLALLPMTAIAAASTGQLEIPSQISKEGKSYDIKGIGDRAFLSLQLNR